MDDRTALRQADLETALRPVVRICGRPLSLLLAREGKCYRLPDGFTFPRAFIDPKTARLYQTLVALYVDRIGDCVRYDTASDSVELIDDPGALIAIEHRKRDNAIRNFRLVSNALSAPEGDALLAAMVLGRLRPDIIDSGRLYESILSATVAHGVSVAKAFVN